MGSGDWNDEQISIFLELVNEKADDINIRREVLRGDTKNIGLIHKVKFTYINRDHGSIF